MNWVIYTLAYCAVCILVVGSYAAWNYQQYLSKKKAKKQRFVTRQEIYQMGYDCGFLNKGYDPTTFDFIDNREMREDMLLVYRGGFTEGLQDYHYLAKSNPLN